MALLRGASPKRAPSTSDVRQRNSTNSELPVDGHDDQLTSGGRAAAPLIIPLFVILCPSHSPMPYALTAAPGRRHAQEPCACRHAVGSFMRWPWREREGQRMFLFTVRFVRRSRRNRDPPYTSALGPVATRLRASLELRVQRRLAGLRDDWRQASTKAHDVVGQMLAQSYLAHGASVHL